MAALVWRVGEHNKSMNIADFMDTAFVIEFDGPGTFIAYQRDKQVNCKQYIKDYRDAVLWCQEQADRMEQEANAGEAADDEMPLDPVYEQAYVTVKAFLDNRSYAIETAHNARLIADLTALVFEAHVAGVEEAKEITEEVQEDLQRNFEPEQSSGAFSVKRALERRVRILKGECPEDVDRDMNRW